METFPRINDRVRDTQRVDDTVFRVQSIDYGTGLVTLVARTYPNPPYTVGAQCSTFIYSQHVDRLELVSRG